MRPRHWLVLSLMACSAIGLFLLYDRPAQSAPKDDEQAIRKATDAYAIACTKGDADAVSAFWAPDAEYIDDEGKSTKGRPAIAALFKELFREQKGIKIRISTGAIRFFNEVAFQDGAVHITNADGEEENSPFTAVWTKKDGQWLLSLVRDQPNMPAVDEDGPHSRLKELNWLVGDWVHEDKGVKTTINVKWMKGDKFLICNLAVSDKGEETMSMIQIVGWDPTGDQLHSWVFDTRGGFAEAYWTRKGDAWRGELAGVTADGRDVTGTNIWRKEGDQSLVFEGIDRDVAGTPLPDVKVTYKRVGNGK